MLKSEQKYTDYIYSTRTGSEHVVYVYTKSVNSSLTYVYSEIMFRLQSWNKNKQTNTSIE